MKISEDLFGKSIRKPIPAMIIKGLEQTILIDNTK